MKMRKTWFSCLLWLLFTGAAGMMLTIYAFASDRNTAGIVVGSTAAAAAVIWSLGRLTMNVTMKMTMKMTGNQKKGRKSFGSFEVIAFVCLFTAAVIYRIYYIQYGLGGSIGGNAYYEMASVRASGTVPYMIHGASYVYTVALSAVFSFVGNKVMAGVCLQLVIQTLTLLLFYFAVRLITCRAAALIAAGCLAFSPLYIKNMYSLSPECLYLFFYCIGLFVIGLYYSGLRRGDDTKKSTYLLTALSGAWFGLLVYLDVMGLTLFFFAAAAFLIEKQDGSRTVSNKEIGKQQAVMAAGGMVSLLVLLSADMLYSGQPFTAILTSWLGQYGSAAGMNEQVLIRLSEAPITGIALTAAAALLIPGFFGKKGQSSDSWIFLLIVLLLMQIGGVARMNYGPLLTAVWSVLAGLGVVSMQPDKLISRTEQTSDPADSFIQVIEAEEMQIQEMQIQEMQIQEMQIQDKPKVKFIENPLPLPKKPAHRKMDYESQIGEEESEYDVTVREEDNFDFE